MVRGTFVVILKYAIDQMLYVEFTTDLLVE